MRYSKGSHAGEQDFELNIASIIDCFTVLITYLLVSASFISIGVLDVSALTQRPASDTTPPPAVTLSIALKLNHDVTIQVEGTQDPVLQIPAKDGKVDTASISEQLASSKVKYPDLNDAVLVSAADAEYDDLVRVVESTKKEIPNVMFGDRSD
jgi:biopolymer transport protein ExbD